MTRAAELTTSGSPSRGSRRPRHAARPMPRWAAGGAPGQGGRGRAGRQGRAGRENRVMAVFTYDPPERFVAGTVGQPGQRTFYLQASGRGQVTSVALEKVQVRRLAER